MGWTHLQQSRGFEGVVEVVYIETHPLGSLPTLLWEVQNVCGPQGMHVVEMRRVMSRTLASDPNRNVKASFSGPCMNVNNVCRKICPLYLSLHCVYRTKAAPLQRLFLPRLAKPTSLINCIPQTLPHGFSIYNNSPTLYLDVFNNLSFLLNSIKKNKISFQVLGSSVSQPKQYNHSCSCASVWFPFLHSLTAPWWFEWEWHP